MIIQIRGTSGSGKSTVMREVMDMCSYSWTPIRKEGRKKPWYYIDKKTWVVVLGHYESPCGGCDTIGSARAVFEMIQYLQKLYGGVLRGILCEGLLLSEDSLWTKQLPDVKVLFLTTPLERCLRQIEGRRKAAGNDKVLDPGNTSRRVAVIERARIKLLEAGVYCRRSSPEQATKLVLSWLNN